MSLQSLPWYFPSPIKTSLDLQTYSILPSSFPWQTYKATKKVIHPFNLLHWIQNTPPSQFTLGTPEDLHLPLSHMQTYGAIIITSNPSQSMQYPLSMPNTIWFHLSLSICKPMSTEAFPKPSQQTTCESSRSSLDSPKLHAHSSRSLLGSLNLHENLKGQHMWMWCVGLLAYTVIVV